MLEAGVEILFSSSDIAVVGLTEVFSKLIRILKARHTLRTIIKDTRPDLLIIIDYPDFNLNLAGFAKRHGIPVLYYISPQVWAWRQGRTKKIAKRIDRLAVILPFEKDFYLRKNADINVEYVGHPILDNIPNVPDNLVIKRDLHLSNGKPILGLLPGSRNEEVSNLLPLMLNSAKILSSQFNNLKCLLPLASTVSCDLVKSIVEQSSLDCIISTKNIYHLLSICDYAFVASGTAALETAIMEVPMSVAYRVSKLSYWIGKRIIKVPYVSLVNLIAEKEVVPELIQDNLTPQKLADLALSVLKDKNNKARIVNELQIIKERLGIGEASVRTAEIAMEMLEYK